MAESAEPEPRVNPMTEQYSSIKAMQLLTGFKSQQPMVPGRRAFFQYRDLGVEKASGGRMRANHIAAIAALTESTGWHYHECEMQFTFGLRGTLVLEFEDGTVATLNPGDALFIPGGMRHNEIYVSSDRETIEICVPANMGTVPCERPAGLPEKLTPLQGD
jgi:mannose-6-phosphate isomerase-like protein (cupin superfamily)